MMASLTDQRFTAYLEDKMGVYPFAKKLMEFCLDYSYKTDWEHFAKNGHFQIKLYSPFRRSEIHFKKNYARIWMPIRTNAKLEDGIEIIKEVLGDDVELGIQDGTRVKALHPVIDTDEKCEALIKWLSHQQDQIPSSSNVITASELFKLVKEDDVLIAINAFEHGLIHEFGPSTQYDLIHQGKPYPPKAILGIACKNVAGGRLLKPEEFSGGEDSLCFKTLRREGFTIQPKSKLSEVEQDLSVAPNIFCMLMVHFFLEQREVMARESETDNEPPLYFPDDAQKYLEFNQVKTYVEDVETIKPDQIVPMIEELAGEIFPYFSFMSRIAPELSKFSKSILFPLDKPEQYVDAYKIGWLGFLSILDSENFDTNHYHCLASLLRHLADTGTEDLSGQSSNFIHLIKSTMRGSAKNRLVDDSFPSNYFTSNKILDQTIKFLPRRSNSSVHDPACGLGGFLMKAFDRIYSEDKRKEFSINAITGADIDPTCVNLAKVFYMCKVFFTDTECMGQGEMIKFLGEVAPNIVQQDSLSGNAGIFPESKNDFIYCNPPFDELIEGSQESSYNHHVFTEMVVRFVDQGGQGVLLLPPSFLTSKRDECCREKLLSKRLIYRLNEYQYTSSPENSKIALLMRKPEVILEPKIRVLTRVDNRINKKFEVIYSRLTQDADFSLNIDKLEQLEELKFPRSFAHDKGFYRAMTVNLSSMLSEEISQNQRKLDDVKYGFQDLDKYSNELNKISSPSFYSKLRNVLKVRFVENFENHFDGDRRCLLPYDPRRGFSSIIFVVPDDFQPPQIRNRPRAGMEILTENSKLNPFYFQLWFRFSGILGTPFSRAKDEMKEKIKLIQNFEEKIDCMPIFLPPLSLQCQLVEILNNKNLLQYLLLQRRRAMPVQKNFNQDIIKLLFRSPELFGY